MAITVRDLGPWADAFANAGTEYIWEDDVTDEMGRFNITGYSNGRKIDPPRIYPSYKQRKPPEEAVKLALDSWYSINRKPQQEE